MSECVQCGYCCTVRACFAGEYNHEKEQCIYLTEEKLCSKYDEIIEKFGMEGSPGFGGGCSSTMFNTVRERVIESRKLDA